MAELPRGTVTFLFSDVEGSTRLAYEQGERFPALLLEHRRLLREAFARHAGIELDTEGDAFFVVFASAREAVTAAAEAQAALADSELRVRMGLHTGEAQLVEGTYLGLDVHRAARIAAAGHGGQVLLSQSTRDLIDADVSDLGLHRLKDLLAPEHVYQLGHDEFPPLKSLYQTNLPIPATPFLGRERELGEVTALLARDGVRLLTLTGPGGTGKTRLALQAAAELHELYPDGVFWVGLAPLRDPALVLSQIAQTLTAKDDLAVHIASKRLLLLLDNFEHLLAAATDVGALLAACPNLELLATSREPPHLEGEWDYAVDPLREDEAVTLFGERARAVDKGFSANGEVAEICRRLDNLPLAIELAASRVKVLSPEALLERLERRLPLLTGGARNAPDRQRTLRATIAWSHELLDPEEQRAFARLSVFAGGCTLEAAEEVCEANLDTLQSLVEKNLLRRSDDRFWMLETIREFAAEQLEASEEQSEIRFRHAEYCVALAEASEPFLKGAEEGAWLDRLDREHANMRAAIAWSLEEGNQEVGLRLAGALHGYWYHRGHFGEGRRWAELVLERAASAAPALREKALGAAGELALNTGDLAAAHGFLEERLSVCEALGDSALLSEAYTLLGHLALSESDFGRARALYERSLQIEEKRGWIASRWQVPGVANSNLYRGARAARGSERGHRRRGPRGEAQRRSGRPAPTARDLDRGQSHPGREPPRGRAASARRPELAQRARDRRVHERERRGHVRARGLPGQLSRDIRSSSARTRSSSSLTASISGAIRPA